MVEPLDPNAHYPANGRDTRRELDLDAEFEQADSAWDEWETRAHRAEAAIARVEELCESVDRASSWTPLSTTEVREALRGDDLPAT